MKEDLPRLKKIEAILNLILKNPSWGSHTISARLPKIKGKPLLSNRGVYKILVRLNLETRKKRRAFVRLNKRLGRKTVSEILANWFALAGKKRLSAQERLAMISRVEEGEPVKATCSSFGISRKNFYKWNKRYRQAPAAKKEIALFDRKPQILRYWRQTPKELEKKVLEIVSAYPELSAHKIVQVLPQIAGKPIIGNHGVQNILRRNKLSTYETRLAYQKAHLVKPILPPLPTQFQPIFNLSLRVLRMAIAPFATIPKQPWFKVVSFIFLSTFVLSTSTRLWLQMFRQAPVENRTGLIFATISILCGSFFFLYSLKYYLTLAIVLGFSRHVGGNGRGINGNHNNHNNNSNGKLLWLTRFFGGNGNGNGNGRGYTGGLQPNLDHIKLERFPFVSIHLPVYNEKKVINRLLTACTSLDYENYEVIVVDDSTDGTTKILEDWKNHPKVKIIHRENRAGFKGGALREALRASHPKTEFVVVFDADFIPYPDTITQFLKYFQSVVGSLTPGTSKVACIQGYQWHVLNKSENWITRGVRSEYAGSYVVERSGTEVLGALKQIAGSVYMVRADILRKYGWGTSITEDFELTLRLYQDGYKVVYTPYLQAPSECVAILKRLVRQRMRWAEGHSHNIRRRFRQILASPKMTLTEKLEFLYLSPYYLQATMFLIGTLSWFISETVFRARLPFWTSLWGWSLVLTNLLSLPLVNTVGLFLEESEEKDYLGIISFVALSYLLVPFQAYASVKGFLEKEEGPWFRTPKTGHITDIFTRGRFSRWVSGILPGRRPAVAPAAGGVLGNKPAWAVNPYLALATANNQFANFKIRPKRLRWVSKAALVILLIVSVSLYQLSFNVSQTYAAMNQSTQYLSLTDSNLISPAGTADQLEESQPSTDCTVGTDCPGIAKNTTANYRYKPGVTANATGETIGAPSGAGWIIEGDANGVAIASGTWTFKVCIDADDADSDSVGYGRAIVWKVETSGGAITSNYTQIVDTTTSGSGQDWWVDGYYTITGSGTETTFDAVQNHLYVQIWNIKTAKGDIDDFSTMRITGDEFATCGSGNNTIAISPTVTVPEFVLAFIFLVPLIPFLVRKFQFKLVTRSAK